MGYQRSNLITAEYPGPDGYQSFGGAQGAGFNDGLLPILLLIYGQSNELGKVQYTDLAAFPQAFQSFSKPSLRAPMLGQISNGAFPPRAEGSWWYRFYDIMRLNGFDFTFVNRAVGNGSLLRDFCGQCRSRPANNSNNTNPPQALALNRAARVAQPGQVEDCGYFGDITVQSGALWKCTTGKPTYARLALQGLNPDGGSGQLDFITTIGSTVGAATDPGTWAAGAASLGATVTDGGLTWTNIDTTGAGYTNDTSVLSQNQVGAGWDPFNILFDGTRVAQAQQFNGLKVALFQNGQSDVGSVQSQYRTGLVNAGQYLMDKGFEFVIGLSSWTSGGSTAQWDVLTAACLDAYTLLQGNSFYAKHSYLGPNLYKQLGTTGPMSTAGAGWLQADGVHLNGLGVTTPGGAADAMASAFLSLPIFARRTQNLNTYQSF